MLGMEQFLTIFGDIKITQVVVCILACFFIWKIYKQLYKFIIEKYKAEKQKEEQIQNLFTEVNKYPEYRKQSREIQEQFRTEIDGLRNTQRQLSETQTEIYNTLRNMQETNDKRERNKIRDRLLQGYRYYTDINKNPNQSWTKMESEAFWALFGDYEEAHGDGYMHTVVQPAMNLLKIIDD